jgi:hypothetical protein
LLPSASGDGARNLSGNLSRVTACVYYHDFNLGCIRPLLAAVLASSSDVLIWDRAYDVVIVPTPVTSLRQTARPHTTSNFGDSSEDRQYVDKALRSELGLLYVGIPSFSPTFFGRVAGLDEASNAVFSTCVRGSGPLFTTEGGWRGWPTDADEYAVLIWFSELCEKLAVLGEAYMPTPRPARRPVARSHPPIRGSTSESKLDIGFIGHHRALVHSRCHRCYVVIPGVLKRNPSAELASKAYLDIGTYAKEVLAVQTIRRFVLGFTICGSRMRIWEFDRLGGIASDQFDINQDGLRFVSTVLGFLWMNKEDLGLDPTITFKEDDGQSIVTINRNGLAERLVIDKLLTREACIAGRATTCWKAHHEEDPSATFVIKDSWQYMEQSKEGELLRAAADKRVVNVARYYHHETILLRGEADDIQNTVRGGINPSDAKDYRAEVHIGPSFNRVHKRVIVQDFGMPIHMATSRSALLFALEGCIQGHDSLRRAGLLHRDISSNNLMINEDGNNPSWPSFLIDLDLAAKNREGGASEAKGRKVGTRSSIAIGALLGEPHSFMHDLESFFWVLFWICIHYNGPTAWRAVPEFDTWSHINTDQLAKEKFSTIADEWTFMKTITKHVTKYYSPLIPLLKELRNVVFPKNNPFEREDENLYAHMRNILRKWGQTAAAEDEEKAREGRILMEELPRLLGTDR